MPDSDEVESSQADPEVAEAPAAPAPQFVTLEEFRAQQASMAQLNETLSALRAAVERPQYAPPPQVQAAPEAEITRSQYITAVREGDVEVAEKYLAQREQIAHRRIDQLEQVGTGALGNLHRQTETAGLRHYNRFKKEIDSIVEGLPAAMKAQGGAYRWAYNTVVGMHNDELEAEAREAALRKPAADEVDNATTVASSRGGRAAGASRDSGIPTVADMGGEGAVAAMEQFREWKNGGDENILAQKMGYANWRDYMEKTAAYR